jgi:hypothetical protein
MSKSMAWLPAGRPTRRIFQEDIFTRLAARTVLGARLEHPMVARISLAGYATKEIQLTDGPINWIALNGRSHGEYWLLKAEHFHVDLQPISQVFTWILTSASDHRRRKRLCGKKKPAEPRRGGPAGSGTAAARSLIAQAAGASADLEDSAWPPVSWWTPESPWPKQAQMACTWAR